MIHLILFFVTFICLTSVDGCCPGLRKTFGKRDALYKYDTNATQQCKDSIYYEKYSFMRGQCFHHANFFSQWWCTKSCKAECKAKQGTVVSCGLKCRKRDKNGESDPTIQCHCGRCSTKAKSVKEISITYEKECLSSVTLPPMPTADQVVVSSDISSSDINCKGENNHYYDKSDPETKALLMEILQNLKNNQPLEADLGQKLKSILKHNVTTTWQKSAEEIYIN